MGEVMPNTYSPKTISKLIAYASICMAAAFFSLFFSSTAFAADGSWVNADEVLYQGRSFRYNSSKSTDHNKLWLDCGGTGDSQYRMMQITSADKAKATVFIANPLYNSKICDYQSIYTPVDITLDITNLSKAPPTSSKPKAYFENTYNRITYEGRFYWNLANGPSNVFYHVIPFSAECPTNKITLTNGRAAQYQKYSPSPVKGNQCNTEQIVEIEMTTDRPVSTASIGQAYYQDSRRYLNYRGDIYEDTKDGEGREYTFKHKDSSGNVINGCTSKIVPDKPKDINDATFRPCVHTENGFTQLGQIDINLVDTSNAASTYYEWSGDAIVESGNKSVVFTKQDTDLYVKNEDGDCKDFFDTFNSDRTQAKLHVMKKESGKCVEDKVSTQKIAGNQNAIICSDKQHPPNGDPNPALWCQNNSLACDNGTTIDLPGIKSRTLTEKQEWCKQHGSSYSGIIGTDVSVVPEGKSPCVIFSGSCETECKDDGTGSCIYKYVNLFLNFLSTGVGVVILIMMIVGGIQYATSSGDPNAIGAAKGRIMNALIALIAFILMYSVLQWLVPGGIF